MTPRQDLRDLLWRAEELLRGENLDVAVSQLLTIVGLKVLADSEAWFVQHGYQIPERAHWATVKRTARLSDALREALTALAVNAPLALFKAADPNWFTTGDEVLSRLMLLVDTVDLRVSDWMDWGDLGFAIDTVTDRAVSRWWSNVYTAPPVNELMADLLSWDRATHRTIYDPACGIGGTLTTTWSRALKLAVNPEDLEFYGQDLSARALYVATWNLLLHGITQFHLVQGDVFEKPGFVTDEGQRVRMFDCVVSEPPWPSMRPTEWGSDPFQRFRYGPLRGRRTEYGFVQHILASVAEDGQAVMVLPLAALFRSGFEQDIRQNLVQADVIETIISVPAGSFSHASAAAALLVLRRDKPPSRRQTIRMVDAATSGAGQRPVLDDALIERAVRSAADDDEEALFAQTVSAQDIAAHQYNLVPGTYFTPTVVVLRPQDVESRLPGRIAEYEAAERAVIEALARLHEVLRE